MLCRAPSGLQVARKYAFADEGEVLRHLIFVANGESAQVGQRRLAGQPPDPAIWRHSDPAPAPLLSRALPGACRAQTKRLIFLTIRCLHCHAGTRAGHIPKRDKHAPVFGFQLQW